MAGGLEQRTQCYSRLSKSCAFFQAFVQCAIPLAWSPCPTPVGVAVAVGQSLSEVTIMGKGLRYRRPRVTAKFTFLVHRCGCLMIPFIMLCMRAV